LPKLTTSIKEEGGVRIKGGEGAERGAELINRDYFLGDSSSLD
jgi:hypothetical protein